MGVISYSLCNVILVTGYYTIITIVVLHCSFFTKWPNIGTAMYFSLIVSYYAQIAKSFYGFYLHPALCSFTW